MHLSLSTNSPNCFLHVSNKNCFFQPFGFTIALCFSTPFVIVSFNSYEGSPAVSKSFSSYNLTWMLAAWFTLSEFPTVRFNCLLHCKLDSYLEGLSDIKRQECKAEKSESFKGIAAAQ